MRNKASIAALSAACALLAVGCKSSDDTSGFKAEAKPSKVDLTSQIAAVRANPKIPAGIKQMALKKLEKQQAGAR